MEGFHSGALQVIHFLDEFLHEGLPARARHKLLIDEFSKL